MLLQRVTTLTHETFIHANYSVLDYLNIPYKKYSTLSYERDHYNEHMRTVNKEKTLFNTEGKQLLQHLNDSRNTGWDGNRIWNSMWDFQY